jgi:hypothetical protein
MNSSSPSGGRIIDGRNPLRSYRQARGLASLIIESYIAGPCAGAEIRKEIQAELESMALCGESNTV